MNYDPQAKSISSANSEREPPVGNHSNNLSVHFIPLSPSRSNISACSEELLPPSYEFTLEQPRTGRPIDRIFRPPPLNQLTPEEAIRALDSAEKLWDQQDWHQSRNRYTTAAAIFRVIEDLPNEAFCLQRLGEVCRILGEYSAARAHIYQAHLLFGKCGEVSRQLMCERWLARVAGDEGMTEEARLLLEATLENSRAAGLRESEGWCLLRLGELEENRRIISQGLDIAVEEKLSLLERRCLRALNIRQDKKDKKDVGEIKAEPPVDEGSKTPTKIDAEASTSNQPQSRTSKVMSRWFGKSPT